MDINQISKWMSYYLFLITALVQLGLFLYYYFFLLNRKTSQFLSIKSKDFNILRPYLMSLSLSCLFSSVLIFIGMYHIHKLEVRTAGVLISLSGLFVIIHSTLLYKTKGQPKWLFYAQSLPPLLGFFFLMFHIIR